VLGPLVGPGSVVLGVSGVAVLAAPPKIVRMALVELRGALVSGNALLAHLRRPCLRSHRVSKAP